MFPVRRLKMTVKSSPVIVLDICGRPFLITTEECCLYRSCTEDQYKKNGKDSNPLPIDSLSVCQSSLTIPFRKKITAERTPITPISAAIT